MNTVRATMEGLQNLKDKSSLEKRAAITEENRKIMAKKRIKIT